jgi:hypothetical protein
MGQLEVIAPTTNKVIKQLFQLNKGELFIRPSELDLYMVVNPKYEQDYTVQVISLDTGELRYFKNTSSAISCTGKLTYTTDAT